MTPATAPRPAATTSGEALRAAAETLRRAGIDGARLDAEVLLAYVCGMNRSRLLTTTRDPLGLDALAVFDAAVARRARREPIAYILGRREFWSLDFEVNRDVLIPRPETELLVETAISLLRRRRLTRPRIADVGTGSGCIAIALARELPAAALWASDVAPPALAVARRNALRLGVASLIQFAEGDLLAPLQPEAPFDLICCNPPYVSSAASLQPELAYEPTRALFAGADGMATIRRLIAEAPECLRRGGSLLVEIGQGQADAVRALAAASGFFRVDIRDDYAAIPRLLVATRED